MSYKKEIQAKIEDLYDEIEKRKADIKLLQSMDYISTEQKCRWDATECCPSCGVSFSILDELSEDGW